jgi:GH15 family glucan-1,4-alpha-glucosidase
MCWVALDRGIRLAEKRSFPGLIQQWRETRDKIYCMITEEGFNSEKQAFTQKLNGTKLDASVLMMPMVFFISPTDPKFVSTLEAILKSVSEGGLTSNNLVFRYNVQVSEDGISGSEGTFTICTFWAVEALSRTGKFRRDYLERARVMFEQTILYGNHLGLFSEEIGFHGQALGNFPQAFTHLSLISAAFNLDRALNQQNHLE